MRRSVALAVLLAAAIPVHADEPAASTSFSLRAAEEPDAKDWTQGASLSYASKDGNATWQADVVAKVGRKWTQADSISADKPLSVGVTEWGAEVGPYVHRIDGGDAPVNDRGLSARLWLFRVPAGSADGPVWDYAADLVGSGGTTLKERGGEPKGYVDVDSKRLVATGSLYYQPGANWFVRLSGGAYLDDVSGSPTALNGRESGLHGALQVTFFPLGLTGTRAGPYELVPVLSLKAQKQMDRSATEARAKGHYELYSALLSLPLAFSDSKRSGLVPSLDISRSVGADLLTGRARSGLTRVALALKY
jgi:hypothetical protein